MRRRGQWSGVYVGPDHNFAGAKALIMSGHTEKFVQIQMNNREHPEAFGWHLYLAEHWLELTDQFEYSETVDVPF